MNTAINQCKTPEEAAAFIEALQTGMEILENSNSLSAVIFSLTTYLNVLTPASLKNRVALNLHGAAYQRLSNIYRS